MTLNSGPLCPRNGSKHGIGTAHHGQLTADVCRLEVSWDALASVVSHLDLATAILRSSTWHLAATSQAEVTWPLEESRRFLADRRAAWLWPLLHIARSSAADAFCHVNATRHEASKNSSHGNIE